MTHAGVLHSLHCSSPESECLEKRHTCWMFCYAFLDESLLNAVRACWTSYSTIDLSAARDFMLRNSPVIF